MKFLVTGGAGFLGSHLCEKLLSLQHKVYCIDNLLTGSEENINNLKNNSNFKFINADIITTNTYENLDVDGIFNLACPASPTQYQIDPIRTIKTIIYGSFNMLEIAKKRILKFFKHLLPKYMEILKLNPKQKNIGVT